jgi:hypothetical protein
MTPACLNIAIDTTLAIEIEIAIEIETDIRK